MTTNAMLGRNFIQAIKPMLGITGGIRSLTIHAGCNEIAVATVEMYVHNGDVSVEEVPNPDETETRRFIFEVTEITS